MGRAAFARAATERGVDFDDFDDFDDEDDDAEHDDARARAMTTDSVIFRSLFARAQPRWTRGGVRRVAGRDWIFFGFYDDGDAFENRFLRGGTQVHTEYIVTMSTANIINIISLGLTSPTEASGARRRRRLARRRPPPRTTPSALIPPRTPAPRSRTHPREIHRRYHLPRDSRPRRPYRSMRMRAPLARKISPPTPPRRRHPSLGTATRHRTPRMTTSTTTMSTTSKTRRTRGPVHRRLETSPSFAPTLPRVWERARARQSALSRRSKRARMGDVCRSVAPSRTRATHDALSLAHASRVPALALGHRSTPRALGRVSRAPRVVEPRREGVGIVGIVASRRRVVAHRWRSTRNGVETQPREDGKMAGTRRRRGPGDSRR